ncbi:non-lysosomal glucosylceramidase-like [Dysidea avara]|uniref:non-lysosomal glucosylceramidase-like n=1 Tax=Dysidea avara TaxID=196820 RepID=UPI003327E78E
MSDLTLKVEGVYADKKCSKTLTVKSNLGWDEVNGRISDELCASKSGIVVQYLDDEDDWITVTNDSEWQETIRLGSYQNYRSAPTLNLKVTITKRATPKGSQCCSGFVRPIPPDPETTDGILKKLVNPTAAQYKYTGEALRAVTLPLGPIGGGCIAVAGDGGLRQWQVSNRISHLGHVPDSFFAIRVDSGSTTKAVVLQSSTWYDDTGFVPAGYITDHVVPDASKKLLSQLPGVNTVEVTAKYPVVEVDYTSGEVPVNVHMEAFNPCIPLDSKNSGLPVIVFTFTVTNTSSSAANVTLLGSLQNFAGWDGASAITNEVYNSGYGGNTNALLQTNGYTAIDMSNPTLDGRHPYNGHMTLAGVPGPNKVSTMLQYDSVGTMWQYFTTSGLPGQGQSGPSPAGMTWNGAISQANQIPAGGTQTFTFMIGWHFPNRYVNWDQRGFGIVDDMSQFYLGNMYTTYWPTIEDVLNYTVQNFQGLSTSTYGFRDAMFETSLPWQLVDSAAGRVSVIRSPSTMWLADGNFYCFEGCSAQTGCCPLNCTHVLNYEMCLSRMFPDLERTMRNVDLQQQISPNAIIPSRTTLPLELRRQWSFWPDYTIVNPASTAICVDGEIGTVLKTYREVRQGAPGDWFNTMWSQVKKIMDRWMTELDDGTGTIKGPQPNTYDCAMYGVNTFIGSLYLCALRAAEEMAKLQNDQDSVTKYSDRFKLGSQNLDKACFTNGKWYTQVVDPKNNVQVVSDGTFVDCLGGQWWAHSLDLGYLLPQEHVQSTVSSVFAGNHTDSFNPADQHPRKFFDQRDAGLYIGRWPDGKVPSNALLYTSEGAWTGLEYPFAGLALYEGLSDIALKVLLDARNKYDGTRRSPWNEVECGDHYTRPMAGFLLFEIASGQQWNVFTQSIQFAPRLNFTNFKGFFITNTAWGQYIQNGNDAMNPGTAELVVTGGSLQLKQLIIKSTGTTATLKIDSSPVNGASFTQSGGMLVTTFASAIEVKASSKLTISIS